MKKQATLILILLIFAQGVDAASVNVSRDLPSSAKPGASLTVSLHLEIDDPSHEVKAVGITETWPAGWVLEQVEADGFARNYSGKIEMIYFSKTGISSKDITYKVRIPQDASGQYPFSGEVVAVGAEESEISGDQSIVIKAEEPEEEVEEDIDVSMPSRVYVGEEAEIRITDEDDDPIEDFRVRLYYDDEQVLSGRTDEDGVYSFKVTKGGEYEVKAERSGYEDYSGDFVAEARETTTTTSRQTTSSAASTTQAAVTTLPEAVSSTTRTATTSTTEALLASTTVPEETTTSLDIEPKAGGSDLAAIGFAVIVMAAVAAYLLMPKAKR